MKNRRSEADSKGGLTRREFGRGSLGFLLVAGGLGLSRVARAAQEPSVDAIPANAAMLKGIQYVPKSAKADQRCGNCVLYTATDDAHGKCALFPKGTVPAEAWCISWSPKPA